MQKLPPLIKRMPPSPSPVEPNAARIPMGAVLGTVSRAALSPDQDKTWRQLQSREVDAAAEGGDFDPRRVLALGPEARAAWEARRRHWIRSLFAGDARVLID